MSGQIVSSAASAAGTVLTEAGKAVGQVIMKNPVGTLVAATFLGATYLVLNSKNTLKIEIQGRD